MPNSLIAGSNSKGERRTLTQFNLVMMARLGFHDAAPPVSSRGSSAVKGLV